MRYPRLQIDGIGPADPFTLAAAPGPARTLPDLLPALAAARDAGEQLIVLWGHRPLHHPDLDVLLSAVRAHGLAPAVETAGHLADPADLAGRDVEVLQLPVHGDPGAHDAAVAHPGAHAATRALLTHPARPRARAVTRLDVDPAGAVRTVAGHVELLTLRGPGEARALEVAWEAARTTALPLELEGLDLPPDLTPAAPRPWDARLLGLRVQGGWLPGLGGGVTGGGDPHLTHALGMPRRDLAWDPPRDPPRAGATVIVAPFTADLLLATSTLPGLTRALRDRGVPARLESAWVPPWNLHVPDAFSPEALTDPGWLDPVPGRPARRQDTARRFSDRLLDRVRLEGASHVVVPGFRAAARLLARPEWPADAHLTVLDLHLASDLGALPVPWPDALTVVSCFPAYLGNYLAAGVSPERLRWFPYPLDRPHLPPGSGPGEGLLAAGNHRRDHALLALAGRHASVTVDVITHDVLPADPALRARGPTDLPGLAAAVAAARAVVLPVVPSLTDAAGITLAAMARHAGRPIVGTLAWGLADHVRHGVDGLLAPATASAFGDALRAAARDDALLAALTSGARASADQADTDALARALVSGQWPAWPVRP